MTVAAEREQVINLFKRVEEIEDVANADNLHAEQRQRLHDVAREALHAYGPIRVRIAADLLNLSDRTVRNWIKAGLLTPYEGRRRAVLDAERVHEIMHLVQDLRANGQDRILVEAVWNRLHDDLELESRDLRESLAQMRRREGILLENGTDEGDEASTTVR